MSAQRFEIIRSRNSGGKAGKGRNETATIQVIEHLGSAGYLIRKSFRYKRLERGSRQRALEKAEAYLRKLKSGD